MRQFFFKNSGKSEYIFQLQLSLSASDHGEIESIINQYCINYVITKLRSERGLSPGLGESEIRDVSEFVSQLAAHAKEISYDILLNDIHQIKEMMSKLYELSHVETATITHGNGSRSMKKKRK